MDKVHIKTAILVTVFAILCYTPLCAQKSEMENPFSFEFSYDADNAFNFSGGIKKGYGYMGMANMLIEFDFEKSGLWKGGQLFVHAANTHGATPSADLYGDMQVASNIEAGGHTYIQEFWYKQTAGNFDFYAGLLDYNAEFNVSEYGGLFINSSFGIIPVISANIPVPIFPLTTLGFTVKWNISPNTCWLGAVYDGSPADFDENPYNINWSFSEEDGVIYATELQQSAHINNLRGTYKVGFTLRNNLPDASSSTNISTMVLYANADQKIAEFNNRNIGVFFHGGYCPSETAFINSYWGLGTNITGMLSKAKDDILGLGIGHVNFANNAGTETVIELSWQKQIHKNFFIQPDFQYIITPSGKVANLENSIGGILRTGLSF